MSARSLENRIARLEDQLNARPRVTLELLIRASNSEPSALKELYRCDPEDPFLLLVLMSQEVSRAHH